MNNSLYHGGFMKKVLFTLLTLGSLAYLFAFDPATVSPNYSTDYDKNTAIKLAVCVGTLMPISVDISSTDYTVTTPCRLITATAGTVIYVDLKCKDGTITNVPIPPNMPIFNIIKVRKTGTDCTNILLWPLE